MSALLEYLSGYESVQLAIIMGLGIIAAAAMALHRTKEHENLESADKRFFAAQQIELAYANQLRLAQDSRKGKGTKKKEPDQWAGE